jgi:probable F420-dependent oxidoreductase
MTIRWTVGLPTDQVDLGPDLISASAVVEMAGALETAGVDACFVTDHPYPPAQWVAEGGHHALDPLVALSFAAAATTRLKLHTNIFVAAYRHPVLSAHGVASLDALSGGRVIFGVAVGYLEPEFEALGVDYHRRGAILDDTVARIKASWAGEPGPLGNALRPLPALPPPIWFGGNSRASVRRVVTSGQGWLPFPASPGLARAVRTTSIASVDDLRLAIADLRNLADQVGRTEPIDICFAGFSHRHGGFEPQRLLDEAAELEALGVTWMSVRLPAPSRAGYLENVERFAAEVLGKA